MYINKKQIQAITECVTTLRVLEATETDSGLRRVYYERRIIVDRFVKAADKSRLAAIEKIKIKRFGK